MEVGELADLIGLTAIGALAFALLLHAAFLVLASLAGDQRGLAYPALVCVTSSLLAWQGIVQATWLPMAVGFLLLSGSAFVLVARRWRPRLPPLSRVEWLALSLLAVAALYSAFPDYRPDQWNNDLVLSKAVRQGPLRTPIFEEHVYYGGNYQYLFTLPRSLSGDDIFNHGAADSITWLLFVLGLAGLLKRLREEALPRLPPVSLLLVWAVFGIPDSTAIVNAKPDPLVLVAALAVVELSVGPRRTDSVRLHAFLLGFLLVAPLALKLTWAPFLLTVFLSWLLLLAVRRAPPAPEPRCFVAGLAVGLLTCAPYFLTNWRFFGNPLHPAQLGPLRSSYWNETFDRYYREVAGRSASLPEYLGTLVQVLPLWTWHLYSLLVPVLLVVLGALLRGGRPRPPETRGTMLLHHVSVGGACFVLTWPLFFSYSIYPRYVYAGVALALAAMLWLLDRALGSRRTPPTTGGPPGVRSFAAAALFLPVVLAGLLREELAFMGRFSLATRERLATEGPPQWRMSRDLSIVNEHRRRVSPNAGYFSRTSMLDMEGTYLLDSAGYRLGSREFDWLQSMDGRGPECPWPTLARLDVAYVHTRFDFDLWPEPYRHVFERLPALDEAGRVRYLEPRRLASLVSSGPGCERNPVEVTRTQPVGGRTP
jgi:hypothetical protein